MFKCYRLALKCTLQTSPNSASRKFLHFLHQKALLSPLPFSFASLCVHAARQHFGPNPEELLASGEVAGVSVSGCPHTKRNDVHKKYKKNKLMF